MATNSFSLRTKATPHLEGNRLHIAQILNAPDPKPIMEKYLRGDYVVPSSIRQLWLRCERDFRHQPFMGSCVASRNYCPPDIASQSMHAGGAYTRRFAEAGAPSELIRGAGRWSSNLPFEDISKKHNSASCLILGRSSITPAIRFSIFVSIFIFCVLLWAVLIRNLGLLVFLSICLRLHFPSLSSSLPKKKKKKKKKTPKPSNPFLSTCVATCTNKCKSLPGGFAGGLFYGANPQFQVSGICRGCEGWLDNRIQCKKYTKS